MSLTRRHCAETQGRGAQAEANLGVQALKVRMALNILEKGKLEEGQGEPKLQAAASWALSTAH